MENQGDKEELLNQIKDKLDSIYYYLELGYDSMTEEEKRFWFEILEKIDPEFYEDQDSND